LVHALIPVIRQSSDVFYREDVMNKRWNLSYAIILLAITQNVRATDPEIMVHEGDLAERGEVVATIHAN